MTSLKHKVQPAPMPSQERMAELMKNLGLATNTTATTETAPETPETPAMGANTPIAATAKSDAAELKNNLSLSVPKPSTFYAVIDYGDTYVQPLILSALASRLPENSYTFLAPGTAPITPDTPTLYIQQYEELPFEESMTHARTTMINSYVIRKALIRKHYLSTTIHNWTVKHPHGALAKHSKPTVSFEVDYAEFLDDALVEAWELHASWATNASLPESEKEWWILKPGMSDRGQGIRLFNSGEMLQGIFEEWEEDMPDTDDETDAYNSDGEGVMTSQLRHFVAQPYIHRPLLLKGVGESEGKKFHIRVYVLAVGALKVYVYKQMLALFAGKQYVDPSAEAEDGEEPDLAAHLTNTCLQDGTRDGSVRTFFSVPDTQPGLPKDWKDTVFKQICDSTGELFEAAARGMGVHFQVLPNAFEVYGLDFVVDANGDCWLLEVNAFPDFKQTGRELDNVIKGLWEGVVDKAVVPFFAGGKEGDAEDMVRCLDIDLGRR